MITSIFQNREQTPKNINNHNHKKLQHGLTRKLTPQVEFELTGKAEGLDAASPSRSDGRASWHRPTV